MGSSEQLPAAYSFGDFRLDVVAGELLHRGTRTRLQGQPLRVLTTLLERPGETVTRDELRQRIWNDNTFVDFDNGLNIAIRKLRTALHDDPENPRYIETLPRRGYRFIAPLTAESAPVARKQNAVPEQNAVPARDVSSLPGTQQQPSRGAFRVRWWIIGFGATILVAGSLFLANKYSKTRRASGSEAITSVAVLPLQNLSGDPTQDYFADGMTEAVITDLAQISVLGVFLGNSSMLCISLNVTLPILACE